MATMNSNTPVRKVTWSAFAGSCVTVAVWVLNAYVLTGGQQIPAEVAAAITTIVSFITGYQVSPGSNEQVNP